ncbi:HBL/NHE enterotoxin family protein [Bacillus cereus]|uniref:non-hemolytic enterotoxin subunit C n=1 Tax=Bacillus cereus TaxID=1396 RepID=UPI000BFA0F03|nr:HBL/NHE enterotoxin family protein [Bacillus cereus]PEQ60944.1 enterotoxin [Bacillus cereus]
MNKTLYKKVILSMIFTGMAASNVVPLHTLASTQTMPQQQKSLENNSFDSGNVKNELQKMIESMLIIDLYAVTIRNQSYTDLSKISSINRDLEANMSKHQENAKKNADYWLFTLKPIINDTSRNTLAYNDTFQASYNQLLTAIDQKDTEKFKNELEKLYNSILKNSQEVDGLLEKLKTFRDKMAEDTRDFKENSNKMTSIVASKNAGIPLLQQQIENFNNTIKENQDKRGGYIALAVFFPAVGTPLIVTTDKNIESAQREIEQLKSRISGLEAEVVILTDAKHKTEHMTEKIDSAITALQNISNQWHTIGAKYNSVIQNINLVNPEFVDFIKEDLKIAKDSWQDLQNYVDKLYEPEKDLVPAWIKNMVADIRAGKITGW